jgi:DNA end-binding protein Ku
VWELINAKIEHRAPTVETGEAPTAKVINIMDALKKSVKAQGKQAAAPTKAQGKRAAASRSAAKKTSRATPKRKSA